MRHETTVPETKIKITHEVLPERKTRAGVFFDGFASTCGKGLGFIFGVTIAAVIAAHVIPEATKDGIASQFEEVE